MFQIWQKIKLIDWFRNIHATSPTRNEKKVVQRKGRSHVADILVITVSTDTNSTRYSTWCLAEKLLLFSHWNLACYTRCYTTKTTNRSPGTSQVDQRSPFVRCDNETYNMLKKCGFKLFSGVHWRPKSVNFNKTTLRSEAEVHSKSFSIWDCIW